MELDITTGTERAALEQFLEHRIAQRTWGRIRHLRVEVTADRVTIHGSAAWYYVKQLALEIVREALGPKRTLSILMDIEVGLVAAGMAQPVRRQ